MFVSRRAAMIWSGRPNYPNSNHEPTWPRVQVDTTREKLFVHNILKSVFFLENSFSYKEYVLNWKLCLTLIKWDNYSEHASWCNNIIIQLMQSTTSVHELKIHKYSKTFFIYTAGGLYLPLSSFLYKIPPTTQKITPLIP